MKNRETRLVAATDTGVGTRYYIEERRLFGWRFVDSLLADSLEEALAMFDQYNKGDEVIATGRRKVK